MSEQQLESEAKSLENAFYREGSEELREELARQEARARSALAEATGIRDEALLGRLASLGIRPETLAALTLIPLVETAWADGVMDEKEREAILRGAATTGLPENTPSFGLLRLWTQERPPPDLAAAWQAYIAALGEALTEDERARLNRNVIGRARDVAEAAGGFLGIGKISRAEQRVLDELAAAFSLRA